MGMPNKQRQYDHTRRDRQSKAFYHTAAWLKLRLIKLRETPHCEECWKRDDLVPATHVHHIREISDHPELRLDIDNLQSLCHGCHSRLHATNRTA